MAERIPFRRLVRKPLQGCLKAPKLAGREKCMALIGGDHASPCATHRIIGSAVFSNGLRATQCRSTSSTKLMAIGGTQLQYAELGAGEPILFVHGAPQDLRAWEPVREMISTKHRFVAYTQRYFGTEPWKDDGKQFSIAMLAEDLTGSSSRSTRGLFISLPGPMGAKSPRSLAKEPFTGP